MQTCTETLVVRVDSHLLPVKIYVDEYSFGHTGALTRELTNHHHTPLGQRTLS